MGWGLLLPCGEVREILSWVMDFACISILGIEARMVREKKLSDRIEKIVANINQLHT